MAQSVYIICTSAPYLIIVNCYIIQYSLIVKLLAERFREVIDALQTAATSRQLKRNVVFPKSKVAQLTISNFVTIRSARSTLYRISCAVSDFYSFAILPCILLCSCACVCSAYFIIMGVVILKESFCNVIMINSTLHLLFSIHPIVILSECIKQFNREV